MSDYEITLLKARGKCSSSDLVENFRSETYGKKELLFPMFASSSFQPLLGIIEITVG